MTGLSERLGSFTLGALCALVFIALYLPIFLVGVLSFFRTRRGRIQWDSFSLEWYGKLLDNRQIVEAGSTCSRLAHSSRLSSHRHQRAARPATVRCSKLTS